MKVIVFFVLLASLAYAQSARHFYDELYKAGGLDRMADAYVCFDDDNNLETFFIYGESRVIREWMTADGTIKKMPKEQQAALKKDFLIVRGYDKGVAVGGENFYDKQADGSWLSEEYSLDRKKGERMKIRLSITPETLRYKRSVEIYRSDLTLRNEVARYGRCQEVSPEIKQHGNP
jgi:hypothetical protein